MKKRKITQIIFQAIVYLFLTCSVIAQSNAPLRRPVSPSQPMWLIHIDTWNYADPQAIIDLVPEDIRPFVVMNISLSIGHDATTSRFTRAEYGYEIAKSWLKTCAENRMWAMIQPSSGSYSHFPDNDMTIYEQLYNDYPNLIGFNYCEQSWGYVDADPLAVSWSNRISHFAKLLELNDRYGGYLVVSWCGNKYVTDINPIAMIKRNASFETACASYSKNFILCEKYTYKTYQHDMESLCLGAYLSGYCGQYGIRYDDSGWTDSAGNINQNFTMATYGAPFLEHVMLTGQTVIDAPELIWRHCFNEITPVATTDGYSTRAWETVPQFDNVCVDLFRKVIDGTVRIPTRQEVVNRTKVVIVNNVTSGTNDDKYSSPETLFEGLYRMDSDGNYGANFNFFKKTGRYPTIPTVYKLYDNVAKSFTIKVNKSDYATRWSSTSSKVTELNTLFAQESSGNIFAGRHENGWVVYNPYKTDQVATGNIQLKYNTCTSMDLSLSQYTAGVVKEYSNKIDVYLSNYDNELNTDLKTDVIKIYGSSSIPTYTLNDRGGDKASTRWSLWSNNVWTLSISHNGPVDVSINCGGSATGRLTAYQTSNIVAPATAPAYAGSRQYEAETFEYQSIGGIVKNGYSGDIRYYSGQGYMKFGTSAAAKVRDRITVLNTGSYLLQSKYSVIGTDCNNIDLYVNGVKVGTPSFAKTATLSSWAVNTQKITLNKGENIIEFKANATGTSDMYFDNVVVENEELSEIWLEAECGAVGTLWNTLQSATASMGQYITIANGNNSTGSAPTSSDGYTSYNFNVDIAGLYTFWARLRAATANDDSFWVRMDGGSWYNWNGLTSSTEWTWDDCQSYNLSAGNHTLDIAYREDGAELDKIYIGNFIPSGSGGNAPTCNTAGQAAIQEGTTGFCGVDGTIDTNYQGFTGSGFANTDNAVGKGVNWAIFSPIVSTKTFTFRYASTSSRTANLIINGTTTVANINFPSTGSWTNWSTVTVTASVMAGTSEVRLEATNSSGLGNIDYMEVIGAVEADCASLKSLSLSSYSTTDDGNSELPLSLEVISTEYYTLTGIQLKSLDNLRGVFIVKRMMTDRSVRISKEYINSSTH